MSRLEEFLALILVMIPIAALWVIVDMRRERREFRKWLREGRWKFEKFRR